ncbi:hypothetical protein GJ496_001596 [Pomphorhynchus laevis]|nr:hypothetical protein GJ496_001596 [Pomphorhynchus laevis]
MQRVIEQNHEVSQFLNNPDVMRQTIEVIRNPTTLQEITRNHDRALINLGSLPSGNNVRQGIYREFQEPMLNVAHEQFGDSPLNTNSSSSSAANTSQVGTENTNLLPNLRASQNTTFQKLIKTNGYLPKSPATTNVATSSKRFLTIGPCWTSLYADVTNSLQPCIVHSATISDGRGVNVIAAVE